MNFDALKKTSLKINLKNPERVIYAPNSQRLPGPDFEWVRSSKKNPKYDFIEILGKEISLSSSLKNSTIFKNKDQLLNSFLEKNKKSKYPIKHKKGEIIDIWVLVIWCADDFPKRDKKDKGIIVVNYYSDEPRDDDPITDDYPSYFKSTSKINIEIIVDKKTFRNLRQKIMVEYYSSSEFEDIIVNNKKISKKDREYEGNPFKKKSFKPNILTIEFDPDYRGIMRQGDKDESIWGYDFLINNFRLK